MAILSKGNTFATGEQVTAAKLNNLVDNATFASGAVDDSTTQIDGSGRIIVKDSGITSAKLNLSATGASQTIASFKTVQDGNNRSLDIKTPASTTELTSPFELATGNAILFQIDPDHSILFDSDGKVGIGTTSPNEILELSSDSPTLRLTDTDTTLSDGELSSNIEFFQSDSSGSGVGASIAAHGDGSTGVLDLRFATGDNTARMAIDGSGNVGIGTLSPTATLHVVDQGSTQPCILVQGATASEGDISVIDGEALQMGHWSGSSFTNRMQITSSGSVQVIGAFSKGSGSFKIDHPIAEKKNTHHLVHSFVESPQADNIYRGKVDLVSGTATVNIDTIAGMTEGTFALLNRDIQCFSSNESGWTAVKASVSGNLLTITAQDDSCSDTISWLVIGERQDQHMYDTDWTDEEGKVIVEPIKES